jgi:hypothetical protein
LIRLMELTTMIREWIGDSRSTESTIRMRVATAFKTSSSRSLEERILNTLPLIKSSTSIWVSCKNSLRGMESPAVLTLSLKLILSSSSLLRRKVKRSIKRRFMLMLLTKKKVSIKLMMMMRRKMRF